MSVVRRFLVLPALARLIRKERGGSRITEGYFAPQGGRTSLVRIDGQQCHLVLITAGGVGEERTEVPRAHGDALLDVCGGKAIYERTTLALGTGPEALIDRYVMPTGLDLISVSFDDDAAAKAFRLPIWFGPEVSDNAGYERHAVALQGIPEAPNMGLNNAMLDAVLDLIEPRFGLGRFGGASTAPRPADNGAAASPRPAAPATAPTPAPAAAKPPAQPAPAAPPTTPTPAPAAAKPPAQTAPAAVPAPAAEQAAKPAVVPAQPAAKPAPEQPSKPAPVPTAAPPAAKPAAEAPAKPEAAQAAAPKPDVPKPDEAKPEAAKPDVAKPAAAQAETKPEGEAKPDGAKGDTRIDDVIESLSQALGAAIQQPPGPAKSDDTPSFETWSVRPRRTQQ